MKMKKIAYLGLLIMSVSALADDTQVLFYQQSKQGNGLTTEAQCLERAESGKCTSLKIELIRMIGGKEDARYEAVTMPTEDKIDGYLNYLKAGKYYAFFDPKLKLEPSAGAKPAFNITNYATDGEPHDNIFIDIFTVPLDIVTEPIQISIFGLEKLVAKAKLKKTIKLLQKFVDQPTDGKIPAIRMFDTKTQSGNEMIFEGR